jgi:DedD protein
VEKPPEKPPAKPADSEARRAAAILSGQGAAAEAPAAKASEYVILIGAFASEENVRSIRTKLQEKGVRTYTEPLDTPGGKRTRVRAGPFPSREAAEKGLEKMKQVGVSGVISAK